MLYSGEGIVLKRRIFKEDDFLAVLLSKEYGKIELVVKSGAKIKSKLAAPLSGIFRIEFTAARGRELDKLTFSSIIERFENLENNLESRLNAVQIAEITDKLISGQTNDSVIYDQILEALRALNNMRDEKLGRFLIYRFLWIMLYRLGLGPETRFCVNCRKTANLQSFSFSRGGMLCVSCRNLDDSAQPVTPSSLAVFSPDKSANGRTNLEDVSLFMKTAELWSREHLSRPIQSLNYKI